MKIAVVGAGLAGLSLCSFLVRKSSVAVTLFDSHGVGGGASGVSNGLLHPFPGRNALRSWLSLEAMAASLALLSKVEEFTQKQLGERTGIIRIALDERAMRDYRKRADQDKDAIWWSADQIQEKVAGAVHAPGLWIPSGTTVYSSAYLDGLVQMCLANGLRVEKKGISAVEELNSFDQVVLATGHSTIQFPECAHLPLEATKGHTVICRMKGGRLPCSLVSLGHITPMEDDTLCQIGSTYEHNFTSLETDPAAIDGLKGKVARFYPPARDFEPVELRAAARVSRIEGYRPIVAKLTPKLWVFTALGSRGLLYHALLAEKLAEALLSGSDHLIPNDLHNSLSI